MAHGGVGTSHVDGNTRLCTATAAEALKESFGCDGQPGSYTDIDHAEVIALWGHNMAETQTVLWSRILDRLEGPNPPTLICVDAQAIQDEELRSLAERCQKETTRQMKWANSKIKEAATQVLVA